MAYLSDDLVTAIKRDCYMPAAQIDFSPSVLLNIADEQIIKADGIASLLVSLKQGYFEELVTDALVAGQAEYELNRYAMWNKIRMADLIDANSEPYELLYIEPEQTFQYGATQGTPTAYLFRNNQIVLFPKPNGTPAYSLRQSIYRRPGRLVPTSSAAQVLSVNAGTGVVTYTGSKPATFTASSVQDFYRGTSPFRRVGTAVSATASPGPTQQTFSLTNAALLQAGDWVCLQDETVFPAIPIELHDHLKDLVILTLTRAQMDASQYGLARNSVMEKIRSELVNPGNRTSAPKRISIPLARVGFGARKTWRF